MCNMTMFCMKDQQIEELPEHIHINQNDFSVHLFIYVIIIRAL